MTAYSCNLCYNMINSIEELEWNKFSNLFKKKLLNKMLQINFHVSFVSDYFTLVSLEFLEEQANLDNHEEEKKYHDNKPLSGPIDWCKKDWVYYAPFPNYI